MAAPRARLETEAFNGKDGKAERIRVVADPEVNALLLRARPLDMVTIRRLIETLDVPADGGR
ncbi:MAG: secretin N-terminal domain-containing protein [Gemmataceae bacterium]